MIQKGVRSIKNGVEVIDKDGSDKCPCQQRNNQKWEVRDPTGKVQRDTNGKIKYHIDPVTGKNLGAKKAPAWLPTFVAHPPISGTPSGPLMNLVMTCKEKLLIYIFKNYDQIQ